MKSIDHTGRISKRAFLVSTSVLFGAVLLALASPLYIRLRLQKQFSVDDGLIVLGVLLLVAAMGMLYFFIDEMYLSEALLLHDTEIDLSFDVIQETLDFEKWAAVSLIILWVAINTVKLSFLAIFRKLIDRIRPMVVYWWCVLAYTILVGLYGISAYIAPCPTFYSFESLTCSQGSHRQLTLKFSLSQMGLDVLGDILILVIPIRLIYKIQVSFSQKIALAFSLCLSVGMVAVTLTRASGILNGGGIDATWETYWQYLSAEVGLLLSTAAAFRSFFVTRARRRAKNGSRPIWYSNLLERLRSALRSIRKSSQEVRKQLNSSHETNELGVELQELPQIPRPTMTGIRTLILATGRRGWTRSNIMDSGHSHSPGHSQILLSQSIEVDVEDSSAAPGAQPLTSHHAVQSYV